MAEMTSGKEFNTFLTWREFSKLKERDHAMMEKMWGKPLVPTTLYFHGLSADGSVRPTNFCLQERINGKDFYHLTEDEWQVTIHGPETRSQLMDIIWGSRYVLQTTGAPPDLSQGRNIIRTSDTTLVLNDLGVPTFIALLARNDEIPLVALQLLDDVILKDIDYLYELEKKLEPTDSESEIYRAKYNVDRVAYTSVVNDLRQLRASMSYPKAIGQLLKQKFSR